MVKITQLIAYLENYKLHSGDITRGELFALIDAIDISTDKVDMTEFYHPKFPINPHTDDMR
jgi:hypothetical protein